MAFTDAEKTKLRTALGYPDVGRFAHTEIENAFGAVSATAETDIRAALALLAADDTQLTAALGRLKVTGVDDVTLDAQGEIRGVRVEAQRVVGVIATILGVSVQRAIYAQGSSGPLARG